jgi:hypothetical protein
MKAPARASFRLRGQSFGCNASQVAQYLCSKNISMVTYHGFDEVSATVDCIGAGDAAIGLDRLIWPMRWGNG